MPDYFVHFLIGFGVCYLCFCVLSIVDDVFCLDLSTLVTGDFVILILSLIIRVVGFIPVTIWGILRHWVTPVPQARFDRMLKLSSDTMTAVPIQGNTYFCRDKRARCLHNKFFFVRVRNTKEEKGS